MALKLGAVVGRVFNVKKTNGNKNGRDWNRTSFGIAIPYTTKDGEHKEEKHFFDCWENLNLTEGAYYCVDGYIRSEKKQNGDGFEYRLYATKAEFIINPVALTGNIGAEESYSNAEDYTDDIPF